MTIPNYMRLEARRAAREAVSGPGKFEGERAITAILYGLSLDGFTDEEAGSVDGGFWIGRIGRWLLSEDSQGFAESTRCATEAEAIERIARLSQDEEVEG